APTQTWWYNPPSCSPRNEIRRMRAGVPFNRRSSSPSANNPTSAPSSRAQSRRGRFSCPSHSCQAEIHSQERNGDALVSLKRARHSVSNDDNAFGPLISSTANFLIRLLTRRQRPSAVKSHPTSLPSVLALR